ncbi:hypothetical protein B0T17DRAFT_596038 [Bombardia bombarda]|uniref:Uncharacterized protein n=1 Tax=Bombardia bombarda TaxID=252184 RepID=A0AA40CGM0_9PEZI|nr:hypothetical protein B0T17DRAFT_596038 [Bombardia bombarda]
MVRVILNDPSVHHQSGERRYWPGDFSSLVYPFDSGNDLPRYLKSTIDPTRENISVKYLVYPLAKNGNEQDPIFTGYPQVQAILERTQNAAEMDRFGTTLTLFYNALFDIINGHCTPRGWTLDRLILTGPVQFDLDCQRICDQHASQGFNLHSSNIHFITEAEALAHSILGQWDTTLATAGYSTSNSVLFLDFGGHNMLKNGCLYHVARQSNDQNDGAMSFYRLDEPFGIAGGSETWEHYFGDMLVKRCESRARSNLPSEFKQEILDLFNQKKVFMGPGIDKGLTYCVRELETATPVHSTTQMIEESWERSMVGPIGLARDRIQKLAEMRNQDASVDPVVVVSGGTACHMLIADEMVAACEEYGLPLPVFTRKLFINEDSHVIACGGARAAGKQLTPEEFLNNGAAIGIQIKRADQPSMPGGGENTAKFLASKKITNSVELRANGYDTFRIVCDPYWDTSATDEERTAMEVNVSRCYDLVTLGRLKRGEWKFDFMFTKVNHDMRLRISLSRKNRGYDPLTFPSKLVPIFFDMGANCIFLGHRSMEEKDVLALLPIEIRK